MEDARSQKSRKCSRRFSGELPAMMPEVMAPIEMPAIQFGRNTRFGKRLVDAGLRILQYRNPRFSFA